MAELLAAVLAWLARVLPPGVEPRWVLIGLATFVLIGLALDIWVVRTFVRFRRLHKRAWLLYLEMEGTGLLAPPASDLFAEYPRPAPTQVRVAAAELKEVLR